MPSGYTQTIQDGATLEQFILRCARGFGALATMRDEPFDAPIPEEFTPSDFHVKELEKCRQELEQLNSLTALQMDEAAEKDYAERMKYWESSEAKKLDTANKYKEMLANVIQWQPPTKDHDGLKEFMVKQITESLSWDCTETEQPKKLTGEDWFQIRLDGVNWNIDYHTRQYKEEVLRSKSRTEWVKALKQSLNNIPSVA